MEPKGPNMDPKRAQMEPKGPNIDQKGAESGSKNIKKTMPEKNRLQDAQGRTGDSTFGAVLVEKVAPGIDFGDHFGAFFHQKCYQKSIAKSSLQKT